MNLIHDSWAAIAHRLANFLGTSHSQPIDTHPLLVDIEMINLLKPPESRLQLDAICMKQKNCTIILKMSVGEVKNRIKKSCLFYIPSWNLSIYHVWNSKVVRNVHNDKVNACSVVGNSFELIHLNLEHEKC
jgi:hypothetical protein